MKARYILLIYLCLLAAVLMGVIGATIATVVFFIVLPLGVGVSQHQAAYARHRRFDKR